MATTSYHIIALVETNLNPETDESELGFAIHKILRCDRSSQTSSKCSGGGALIVMHNSLQCYRILSGYHNTDSVLIKCASSLPHNNWLCLHPSKSSCFYIFKLLLSVGPGMVRDNLIVVGDFNLHHVDWHDNYRYFDNYSCHIMNTAALHDLN